MFCYNNKYTAQCVLRDKSTPMSGLNSIGSITIHANPLIFNTTVKIHVNFRHSNTTSFVYKNMFESVSVQHRNYSKKLIIN